MKTADVYIYGIIDSLQDNNAGEWGYVNLKSVKNQIDTQGDCEEINLHIHSEGGDVSEGFAIHDYLKSLGKPINTKIEGNCFSIATVIALAGDKRSMTANSEFLIHNPWGWAGGGKEDIQKYADELGKIENKIANFYASKTNISSAEALDLMKVETTFTPEQALEKGFITEIATEMRAVALYRPTNKKTDKMAKDVFTKEDATKEFKGLGGILNSILKKISGKPLNLVLQDGTGTEIDFTELEDGDTPKVGDKATVDGSPADGEFVMPSGETYVFENGELKEIKPKDGEGEDTEALKQENASLKEKIATLEAQNKETEESIKGFKKELKNLKKNISSAFDYEPAIDGNKGSKKAVASRTFLTKSEAKAKE